MKTSSPSRSRQRQCTAASRRSQLLAAFDRSGLSAAAFARQHKLSYTTFCGWRQQRAKSDRSPAFVQVELPAALPPVELLIELGAHARLRLQSERQIEWAARLLQRLQGGAPC